MPASLTTPFQRKGEKKSVQIHEREKKGGGLPLVIFHPACFQVLPYEISELGILISLPGTQGYSSGYKWGRLG